MQEASATPAEVCEVRLSYHTVTRKRGIDYFAVNITEAASWTEPLRTKVVNKFVKPPTIVPEPEMVRLPFGISISRSALSGADPATAPAVPVEVPESSSSDEAHELAAAAEEAPTSESETGSSNGDPEDSSRPL